MKIDWAEIFIRIGVAIFALFFITVCLLIAFAIYVEIRDGPMSYGVVLLKREIPESVELLPIDKNTTIPIFHPKQYALLIEGYTTKNVFKRSWVNVDQTDYQKYSIGDSYGKRSAFSY